MPFVNIEQYYSIFEEGNIQVVKYLIHKHNIIPNEYHYRMAYRSGNIELINYIKNTCVVSSQKKGLLMNSGFWGVCEGGHLDLLKDMLIEYNDPEELSKPNIDTLGMILCAAQNSQIHIIKYLIKQNIVTKGQIHTALIGACESGNIETVNFFIEQGANNWNYGLNGACELNQFNIAQYMIQKGAVPKSHNLYYAKYHKNIRLVDLLYKHNYKLVKDFSYDIPYYDLYNDNSQNYNIYLKKVEKIVIHLQKQYRKRKLKPHTEKYICNDISNIVFSY